MAYRFKARSTTPGAYALRAAAFAVLEAARNTDPGAANVLVGTPDYYIYGAAKHPAYTPAVDISLYTLTSGIVWPTQAHVSSVETTWGPTGVEFHGTLNMSLYMLIPAVAPVAAIENVLERANRYVEARRAWTDILVVFTRGSKSITVPATMGKHDHLTMDGQGLGVRLEMRDFLIRQSSLAGFWTGLADPAEPYDGDTITVTLINGDVATYTVMPPQQGQPPSGDTPYGQTWRIHTKQTDVEVL